MKNWFDYTIEERIEINKKQGFTVDTLCPKGTKVRERWDKIIEDTMHNINLRKVREVVGMSEFENIMNLSPDEFLKKKT